MAANNNKHADDDEELRRKARLLLDDSDLMRDYWERGHTHFWTRTVQRITSAVGQWLMAAIASGAAAGVIVYGSQNGWFK